MSRVRPVSKTPLAVAAILATPLFFVSLMALSLALEKPTVDHVLSHGKTVVRLAKASGSTEALIWGLALVPSAAVVLAGLAATLVPRYGVVVSALAAIAATLVLLLPLGTWEHRHTARFPQGTDLIPKGPTDLFLRGEWEGNARRTAEQLSYWTFGIAGAAIVLTVGLGVRQRRLPVPPPPPTIAGQPAGAGARLDP